MGEVLGRVVEVTGTQIAASVDREKLLAPAIRIGALVKIPTAADVAAVGVIRALRAEASAGVRATVELLGSLRPSDTDRPRYGPGLSQHPVLGAPVLVPTEIDLTAVYARPSADNIRIAALYDDPERSAFVAVDELLSGHFAVFGMSGSGKSCAVALILQAILSTHENAHIIVIDPHNEYSAAFGDLAEVINIDNLDLPFWLFDFEEAVEILVRGGTIREQESQAIILKDAMTRARRVAAERDPAATSLTVDTPVPFRISDLIRFVDEAMGKLDNPDTAAPYLRLKTRLELAERRPPFRLHVLGPAAVARYHGARRRPAAAHSRRWQAAGHPRPVGGSLGDRRRRGVARLSPHLRFLPMVRARADAAGAFGLRGGAPLRPGRRARRFRRDHPRDHPDCQGGTKIRHRARAGLAAPFGSRGLGLVAVRNDLCAAPRQRYRPARRRQRAVRSRRGRCSMSCRACGPRKRSSPVEPSRCRCGFASTIFRPTAGRAVKARNSPKPGNRIGPAARIWRGSCAAGGSRAAASRLLIDRRRSLAQEARAVGRLLPALRIAWVSASGGSARNIR